MGEALPSLFRIVSLLLRLQSTVAWPLAPMVTLVTRIASGSAEKGFMIIWPMAKTGWMAVGLVLSPWATRSATMAAVWPVRRWAI
ncbi:hypothetical protein D3C86_1861140 [compost metagenome]